ncbi:recombinase family protein [Ktedonobacter racemifer]|uniref:Resolvase domain protein n=1 Tax=Ktedonobacter racemifer DSM 44963 TaxID=485913 RepID=D6U545_KTERA|nr:recombinase family protein [Ktedonobacter racemifer]EFH81625.1 Resolvase domain protein [Ktedonobacter racemifer DSM 44963]
MSTRRIISADVKLVEDFTYDQEQLPIDKPIAQYIRQSSVAQKRNNRQSTAMQDEDLKARLLKQGWKDELILKFDQDQGTSGQKRIDERIDMNRLFAGIKRGEIKAVACYDPSRLFRDLTRVQSATFVDLCTKHKVPVLTWTRIYWCGKREDSTALFDKLEEAANYIDEVIKGKLLPAKLRAIEEDMSYGGHAVPMGYVVFTETGNDEDRPRKHYKIYEPHAKLVRWLFKRFRELDGNLARLGRELRDSGFKFPAFTRVEKIPHVGLRWDGSGYPLRTRPGIIGILTNRAYIGWYLFSKTLEDGTEVTKIISKQAHDPIVPMGDFMYAYSRLSSTTLDGEPNEDRPKVEQRYGVACDALLEGVLESNGNPVYVMAVKDAYVARTHASGWKTTELSVQVKTLDKVASEALIAFLASLELKHQAGIEDKLYKQAKSIQEHKEQEIVSLDEQLENVEKAIREAELEKKVAKQEEYEQGVREAIKDLKRLNAAKAAIEAKLNQADTEAHELEECENLIECAVNDWCGMKFESQKRLVKLVTGRANIVEVSPHFLKLELIMKAPLSGILTGFIYRSVGCRPDWTSEEGAIIREMYPTEDRAAILEALPERTWHSIRSRASIMRPAVLRHVKLSTTAIPESLSYSDVALMEELGITDTNIPYWTAQSEQICERFGVLVSPGFIKRVVKSPWCKEDTSSVPAGGSAGRRSRPLPGTSWRR